MSFIDFDAQKCDECFKCLRACPTKAISFSKNNRKIIEDLCINCGLCQMHCPQGALTIHLDVQHVKNAILAGKKVVGSIAPSFAGIFDLEHPGQMVGALKTLGFDKVEETARGAEIVSRAYEKTIGKGEKVNMITSCCPSSNYLIEKYFPKSTEYIIPVVSPMVAHGYDIKERYGSDVFTVFIGPCLAKKAEALDFPKSIDAVITFRELDEWLKEEKIELKGCSKDYFDCSSSRRGKAYPMGGSLWKNDLETRINPNYKYVHIDGIEDCKSFLESLEKGMLTGYCAELNICSSSCINGPHVPNDSKPIFERKDQLSQYVNVKKTDTKMSLPKGMNLIRTFKNTPVSQIAVNEHQVAEVLLEMGKYTQKDQLNCGACGYATCYDKAVAIVLGYSDIEMCLDRLRQKAESLQNIIFDSSPNAICILDSEMRIKAVNPSFNQIFNATKIRLTYWPIGAIVDDEIFEKLALSNDYRQSKKLYLESVDRTFFANVVKIQGGQAYVGIFTDITESENNREELEKVKEETLITCQEVIDKQMRVAQEIASLLGETTAETKVGLNKLKKLVLMDERK